ncbi:MULTISPECIES: hypothetical protein [unclassified Streptomyces]|uniref:hypothetical protein n=1 Tax=unclassified Streptomyces TaxID=2593676 RepID=UPI00036F2901|nr:MULTISPECIES: hypothetical protein [unclassified Streptomyces]MYX33438.1 hypothetical protein [Streptomyces sp. SID8377]
MISTARTLLTPTGDQRPVERAAVDSILDVHPPEMFLWIVFTKPDGGARVWHAWTDGGTGLGDRIDGLATAAGMDAADWLHIGDRHCQQSSRGRIEIQAYPLRPVLADVQAGVRGPDDRRTTLREFVDLAAELNGQRRRPGEPPWLGYGPAVVNRVRQAGSRA